jgi:hypothetical protein
MRLFVLAAVSTTLVSFAPAHAQEHASLSGMYWVNGSCDRLVTRDGDQTAACNKAIGIMSYSNGRKSYWFSIPKKALISFSGTHETLSGKGGILDLDLVTLAVVADSKILGSGGTGSCTFDDPWKGPAHIRCRGSSDAGAFVAEFTTDGRPPHGTGSK